MTAHADRVGHRWYAVIRLDGEEVWRSGANFPSETAAIAEARRTMVAL